MNINIRIFIFFIIIYTSGINTFGQIKSDLSGKKNNELIDNYKFLLISFDYSTNTNSFDSPGQTIKQPFYTSSLTFIRNNLDLSFSILAVKNSDDSLTGATLEYDLSLGHTFYLNKSFYIYPCYTHMEYDKNVNSMHNYTSDIIQLYLNYDIKNISFFQSSNYLIGIKNTFYFTFSNSYNFYIKNFPFKRTQLSFHPELDFNISDRNFYNIEILNNYDLKEIIGYYETKYDLRFPVLSSLRWYQRNDRPSLDEIKNIFIEDIKDYKPYLFTKSYTLSSINIVIPIYYTFGDFSLNITGYLFVPWVQSELYDNNVELYFNTGVSYMIAF